MHPLGSLEARILVYRRFCITCVLLNVSTCYYLVKQCCLLWFRTKYWLQKQCVSLIGDFWCGRWMFGETVLKQVGYNACHQIRDWKMSDVKSYAQGSLACSPQELVVHDLLFCADPHGVAERQGVLYIGTVGPRWTGYFSRVSSNVKSVHTV